MNAESGCSCSSDEWHILGFLSLLLTQGLLRGGHNLNLFNQMHKGELILIRVFSGRHGETLQQDLAQLPMRRKGYERAHQDGRTDLFPGVDNWAGWNDY